jgi:hypothetical protein
MMVLACSGPVSSAQRPLLGLNYAVRCNLFRARRSLCVRYLDWEVRARSIFEATLDDFRP